MLCDVYNVSRSVCFVKKKVYFLYKKTMDQRWKRDKSLTIIEHNGQSPHIIFINVFARSDDTNLTGDFHKPSDKFIRI